MNMNSLKNALFGIAVAAVTALPLAATATPTVTINSVTQRWPWNNKVDISYTVNGGQDRSAGVYCGLRFAVTANGTRIALTGVDLAANEELRIDHRTDGLLRIRKGSVSVYEKYTGADDLYVEPGTVTVTVEASRAGKLTVWTYGRYV